MVTPTVLPHPTIQRVPMGYETYLIEAPENRIAEWFNEEMIVYMPPKFLHQEISGFLYALLRQYSNILKNGQVMIAPFEVKLWADGPAREPDILFVSNSNLDNLNEKRYFGGPDLVVEIVSPSSAKIDRVDKFIEYEQAGVLEYWLIDPRPHQRQADFYIRDEDGAFAPAPIDDAGRFYSTVLPDFWLDLRWLWQHELPNTQLLVAEILKSAESASPELRALYQQFYDLLK